jgi:hypothetical protein
MGLLRLIADHMRERFFDRVPRLNGVRPFSVFEALGNVVGCQEGAEMLTQWAKSGSAPGD